MKNTILSALILVMIFLSSCDNDTPALDPVLSSSSDLICKFQDPLKGDSPGQNQSCIDWEFVEGRLMITHFNAGFNCCPEAIQTSMRISGDTLYIIERDSLQLCRCNCLYNVDLIIDNLQKKTYVIRLDEPFVLSPMEPLVFTIDLKNTNEGRVCQERDYYPWR